jgi:glutathione S-transferase
MPSDSRPFTPALGDRMLQIMAQPIKLYRHALSGHSHRVELLLSLLELPFESIDVDLLAGENKQPAFLHKNPLGQVPVIEDAELTLADSNAILVYLASRYDQSNRLYPREPVRAAQVQRWLSLAAGELRTGPGQLRLNALLNAPVDRPHAQQTSARLLALLESQLAAQAFLLGETLTIADVSMYAYTALAPEGGVSLASFPAIKRWLARIEALPRFVPIRRSSERASELRHV